MSTGVFQPFRFYNFTATKPELSENNFYCSEYDHWEYIVMPSTANKLVPFILFFPSVSPVLAFDYTATTFEMVCSDSGIGTPVTINTGDFAFHISTPDVYLSYSAAIAFTPLTDIKPGRYHLVIKKIKYGSVEYSFYSDTFIIKQFINGTS
jgi:hypothetical protein